MTSASTTTPTILAAFSASELDDAVFDRALELARERSASLVLLDVRHRQAASQLGDMLASQGVLPRRVIERLKRTVKDRRSEAIRRTLDEMRERAESEGVTVEVREEKGDFAECTARAVRETKAATVVVERELAEGLGADVEIVAV